MRPVDMLLVICPLSKNSPPEHSRWSAFSKVIRCMARERFLALVPVPRFRNSCLKNDFPQKCAHRAKLFRDLSMIAPQRRFHSRGMPCPCNNFPMSRFTTKLLENCEKTSSALHGAKTHSMICKKNITFDKRQL